MTATVDEATLQRVREQLEPLVDEYLRAHPEVPEQLGDAFAAASAPTDVGQAAAADAGHAGESASEADDDVLSWVSDEQAYQLEEALGPGWRDQLPADLESRWGNEWRAMSADQKRTQLDDVIPGLALPFANLTDEELRNLLDGVADDDHEMTEEEIAAIEAAVKEGRVPEELVMEEGGDDD